jgi:hypothetical protein
MPAAKTLQRLAESRFVSATRRWIGSGEMPHSALRAGVGRQRPNAPPVGTRSTSLGAVLRGREVRLDRAAAMRAVPRASSPRSGKRSRFPARGPRIPCEAGGGRGFLEAKAVARPGSMQSEVGRGGGTAAALRNGMTRPRVGRKEPLPPPTTPREPPLPATQSCVRLIDQPQRPRAAAPPAVYL